MSALTVRERLDQAKVFRLEPGPAGAPREVDLAALSLREPARPQMMLPALGAIPLGEPTLLAADGGTGKSNLALLLAVCVSTGKPFLGEHVEQRNVAYLSFEDPEPILHWRLARACFAAGVTMMDLPQRLSLFDGTTFPGTWFGQGEGAARFTADFEWIKTRIKGADLIIVDGAADVFSANENDRSAVKAFVRGLRTLIPQDGALLLLAHVDKAGVKEGGAGLGYSGSTGWNNSVRSRLFMYRETEDDGGGMPKETGNIVLEVRKSNYGATGGRLVIRYDKEYDIFRRVDEPGNSEVSQDGAELQGIVDVIRAAHAADDPVPAATGGTRTAHSVAEAREGFPKSLQGQRGRRRFYRHLESLRAAGRIRTEARKNSSRKLVEVLCAPALS